MFKKSLITLLVIALAVGIIAWFKRIDIMLALLVAHKASAREPLYPYTTESPFAVDKTRAERFEPVDEYVYWPN